MTQDSAPISSVAVAGGGIVGWSAAAALRRRLPMLDVTVIPIDPPGGALADRISCTLPSIVDFHHDLGLTEADTLIRAGSGLRLGTRFEGWAEGQPDYVHAYGDCGQPSGGAAFHQHWLRAARSGNPGPFECYSTAAMMAASGRFAPPESADQSPGKHGYGLHIDPGAYRGMMRAFALHLGATERATKIAEVTLRPDDGFIATIALDDGSEVSADLYVDATGPAALVRGALDRGWEDWSQWLIADRVLIADGPPTGEAPLLDRAIALEPGWSWEAQSPTRSSRGLIYSSRHLGDSEAADVLRSDSVEPATIRAGRLSEPWLRNCVAIGDSAVAIEPLEFTNLHLAHSAIDRLVAMMPDRDCSPVELWDYNRQANAETDRVRDFVLLHYAVAERSGDFWKDSARPPLPPSLDHTLTQFRERGRLPFYEEETFARDSWLAVLLGQGVVPRRIDPLLDSIPQAQSDRELAQIRGAIEGAVRRLPSHSDYLSAMAGRA